MTMDFNSVALCKPQQRLGRVKMNCHRCFIPGFLQQRLASVHIQNRIRLHFVFRRQDAELFLHQVHPFRITEYHLGSGGAEIKLVRVDFLQARHAVRFFDHHRGLRRLGFRYAFRRGNRKSADFKVQRIGTGGLHIQYAAVKVTGSVTACQGGPFALFRLAESQVLIGFHSFHAVGNGDHEICAVQLILLHFNAQVIFAALHQVEIPSRGIPAALPSGGFQRAFGGPGRLRSTAVPSVSILAEIRCIDSYRVIRQYGNTTSQQGENHQENQ